MKIKKHWTFKYFYSRLKQYYFYKLNPNTPWMTREAIVLLDKLIRKDDIGLEFGSGRSTAWFATRCKFLTSIEHNEEWYNFVKQKISNLSNVDYRLRALSDNPLESEYFKSILNFEDESLDFIVNDGKYRELIASYGVDKLKKGGIYILDNAERYIENNLRLPESMVENWETSNYWKKFNAVTANWRKIWTSDGVSSTLILFKSTL